MRGIAVPLAVILQSGHVRWKPPYRGIDWPTTGPQTRAKAKKLGLWGACPHAPYNPYHGVETRR
jgi:hypothetical protein